MSWANGLVSSLARELGPHVRLRGLVERRRCGRGRRLACDVVDRHVGAEELDIVAGGDRVRLSGAIADILVAPENPQAVIRAIADPRVDIVSLTITEKGYCHDPATGRLDESHPDVLHDLANPERPRGALRPEDGRGRPLLADRHQITA